MKWFVLFLLPMIALADTGEFLHRAVEPARMGLDISISGEKVTVYVVAGNESLKFLSSSKDEKPVYQALKEASWFAVPSEDARCQVVDHSVNQEANRINGFQILRCDRPGKLAFVEINLYQVIPKLRAVDVWLTSKRWQKKTTIYSDNPRVAIQSGTLK